MSKYYCSEYKCNFNSLYICSLNEQERKEKCPKGNPLNELKKTPFEDLFGNIFNGGIYP